MMDRGQDDAGHNSALENLNVFDDDFAVDDFDIVADGYRPGRGEEGGSRRNSEEVTPPIHSVSAYMTDAPFAPTTRRLESRNSIRKSRGAQQAMENPFRSNEDDDDADDTGSALGRSASIQSQSTIRFAPGMSNRPLSIASSNIYAPSQSPAPGASEPSHPYAMYPQGTILSRTLSVSTTATARTPTRALVPESGPTHPYSMYPQNVVEDDDDDDESQDGQNTTHPQRRIPVGFPGAAGTGTFRRRGPDGEEQDIIGIDGHTEQLPPYSEYPEDGTPKDLTLPTQTATVARPSGPQLLPLPLVPTLRPQSMSDPTTLAAHQGFAQMETMDSQDTVVSKSWSEKSWKEKRKTKICGIPFWWILLSVCVMAFIAIVLGGAIGGFMATQRKQQAAHRHPGPVLPPPSSLLDASTITSSGTPPATGTYALSLGAAQATQAACLTNQSYAGAWDCDIPGPQEMAMVIEIQSGSSGCEGAYLFPASSGTNYSYGTQPMDTAFAKFLSVQDNDDVSKGPAFYFETFYDKLVIAEPDAFPSTAEQKRDSFNMPREWGYRRQIEVGDQPWFCYWNGTFLEAFVYVDNYTGSAVSTTSASYTTSSVASPMPTAGPSTTGTGRTSMASTTSHAVSTTAIVARAAQATGRSLEARQVSYGSLKPFGYVVKIEERRIQDSPAPYCQKMQMLNDGTVGVVNIPGTSTPWTIQLSESDPSYAAYESAGLAKRDDTVPGGCHCQWFSGAD